MDAKGLHIYYDISYEGVTYLLGRLCVALVAVLERAQNRQVRKRGTANSLQEYVNMSDYRCCVDLCGIRVMQQTCRGRVLRERSTYHDICGSNVAISFPACECPCHQHRQDMQLPVASYLHMNNSKEGRSSYILLLPCVAEHLGQG